MQKKETIDERLTRLNKYWDEVLTNAGIDANLSQIDETAPQQLVNLFGLTTKEAKAWLKNEPKFSSDVSYHEPQNRRKVTRTHPTANQMKKVLPRH